MKNIQSSIRAAILAGACATGAACSEGNTEPKARPGFQFISGRSGADTIEANISTLLVGELRDSNNAPIPNRAVSFSTGSLRSGLQGSFVSGATLTFNAENAPSGPEFGTTDASGRITVRVRLGRGVGTAVIRAGTSFQNSDSAVFVVRAGAAARTRLFPRDTAVYPTARLQYRRTNYDRFFNETTGSASVTYVTNNDLAVSSSDIATPRNPGRETIIARTGAYADTIFLTVLPTTGTVVASLPNPSASGLSLLGKGISTINLDGSGYKEYAKSVLTTDYVTAYPRWSIDKKSIFTRIQNGAEYRIWTVPLDGSAAKKFLTNPVSTYEEYPSPSSDGLWVYFHSTSALANIPAVYRAKVDGTGAEELITESPVNTLDKSGMRPQPSPSGTYIAYTGIDGSVTRIRNVLTGQRTPFIREAYAPTWMPNGTRLAYIKGNPGPIYTSEFDGTDERMVTTAYYWGPMSWTPDGKYILAYRAAQGGVFNYYDLIDAATGVAYKIPFEIGQHAVLRPYN